MSSSAESKLPTIPVIIGPTAIGKTSIAIKLAKRFDLEIVSCDSRQIYKFMNIGTAKPSPAELGAVPYHLIDFVTPDQIYSAARYRNDAEEKITEIIQRKKMPLIVGGTGLYLKALIEGLFLTPDVDWSYRDSLQELSSPELHEMLVKTDPESAVQIPVNNRVRVIRALEITYLTGRTKSELSSYGDYLPSKAHFRIYELSSSRQELYQFINLRVDKMIQGGLVAEVEALGEMGYRHSPVLAKTVGYREVLEYLSGVIDMTKCIELIKQRTRNYAKRQQTWFRGVVGRTEIDINHPGWCEFLIQEIHKLKLDT